MSVWDQYMWVYLDFWNKSFVSQDFPNCRDLKTQQYFPLPLQIPQQNIIVIKVPLSLFSVSQMFFRCFAILLSCGLQEQQSKKFFFLKFISTKFPSKSASQSVLIILQGIYSLTNKSVPPPWLARSSLKGIE